tara:strand:+ start:1842 stop:3920 length:2079 start_codon:yes stop_codon:yes gene_type:complete
MALQASGAIKYSEIETEFGRSYSTIGENWTRVFGPAYDDSYFEIYNDYDIASDNYVKLPGTWNVLFPFGLYAGLGHYVQSESTYTTTYGPEYVAGQNYLKFFQGVWTVFYGGVEIGTLNGAFLTIGTTRYSGGNLAEDNGNTWVNPSYYQVKVEELVDTYKYFESYVEVASTTTPGSTITVGNKRYTMGSQISGTIKYQIKIEEFGPDETTGTYSFYYGSLKGTATAPNNSVTETSTFGNTRYRVGEIQTTDSTAAYYKIIVEKNPKSYVRLYEGIFTVVYDGIEYGQYTGAYLYVNQYRFSGGNLVVDNGNQFQNPNYYELTVDQTEVKWSLGNYRMDDGSTYGGIKMPLDYLAGALKDTDIPFKPDPIKFSNFYNSRLNVIVDYYSNPTIPENRPENGTTRYTDPSRTVVVGQFLQRPVSTTGKAVRMVIGKDIGSIEGTEDSEKTKCAIRTGSAWNTDTKLRIDVGPAGRILGGGGKGGDGLEAEFDDPATSDGKAATSALGVEYEGTDNTMVSVTSGGVISGGFGGGGGGGTSYTSEKKSEGLFSAKHVYLGYGGGGGGGAGLPFGTGGIGAYRAYGCKDNPSNDNNGCGDNSCEGADGANGSVGEGGEGGAGTTMSCRNMTGGTGGDGGESTIVAQSGGPGTNGEDGNSNGGVGGAAGAAIRRTGGLTLTITNNGTITGDQTATGVA